MTQALVSLPGWTQPRPAASLTPRRQQVRARWDATIATDESRRRWGNVDYLSARAAASPDVRRKLRVLARYVYANCPLAQGVIRRWADFIVGTGPRLQVNTKNRDYNREVQVRFNEWAVASRFYHKLHLASVDEVVNGEGFGIFVTNRDLLRRVPVTLDIKQIEADQVANPAMQAIGDDGGDGIIFSDNGNVIGYRILRNHPGDTFAGGSLPTESDTYSADEVYHYFNPMRVGQVRGVTKLASSVELVEDRKLFRKAVLAAATIAAAHAGVFYSEQSPEPDDTEAAIPFESIELDRGSFTTIPNGYRMEQLKAEQPATTFEMFERELVREIARSVNMPYAIAAGDWSSTNFSGGKLDHLPFWRTIVIEQDRIEDAIVDRTFSLWFAEAAVRPDYLPPNPSGNRDEVPAHQWFWDGQVFFDPREATAADTGLKNGSLTLPRMYAKQGLDIDTEHEADAESMGISLAEYRKLVLAQRFGNSQVQPVPRSTPDTNDDPEAGNE